MEKSEKINDLAAALSKAQSEIKGASKDKDNPFFKSKYADLSAVWDACRDALTKNDLSVIQSPEQSEGGGIAVETMLLHSSGQFVSGRYVMPITDSKVNAQSIGSAITYARRYALAAMVGVAPEDDDGNSAVGNGEKPEKRNIQALSGEILESTIASIKESGTKEQIQKIWEKAFSECKRLNDTKSKDMIKNVVTARLEELDNQEDIPQ